MTRLAILGASGHGRVVADAAECSGWTDIVFFDDAWPDKRENEPWPILGDFRSLLRSRRAVQGVVVAIGDNGIRAHKCRALIALGLPLATIVHPRATVSRLAHLGDGSVVLAGAVINAGARLGLAAIINTGATVDHDCQLGEAVHLSPGAHLAGGVVGGDLVWIGIGASVRQGVRIGEGAVVGMGAAVVKDVPPLTTVVGVPARPHAPRV